MQDINIIGVLISIILIFLLRKKWKLYRIFLLAGIIMAVFAGITIKEIFQVLQYRFTSSDTIHLFLMVITITALSYMMEKTGALKSMMNSLKGLISDARILLIVLPASMSLLTIPGGVILSAPMVEETGHLINLKPAEMSLANIIFRHFFVIISPLSPSLILMSGITGLSIASYIKYNAPIITVTMFIIIVFMYRTLPLSKSCSDSRNTRVTTCIHLVKSSSPFIVAIVLGLVCNIYLPLSMLAGLAVAILINLPIEYGLTTINYRIKAVFRGINWEISFSLLAIIFFKELVNQTGIMDEIAMYLNTIGIPLLAQIIILPLTAGLLTGSQIASLGIILPLLLLSFSPEMLTIKYLGLIYFCSYIGYFISPLHICTLASNEYFKVSLGSIWLRINIVGIILLIISIAMTIIY